MVDLRTAFSYSYFTVTQTVLLGILFGLLWYGYRSMKKSFSFWKDKGISFVPPSFPEGNFKIFSRIFSRKTTCFPDMVKELYDYFPEERYHGIYQLLMPTLVIKDPELIKAITVKDFDSFLDHKTLIDIDPDLDPLIKNSLFASQGQKWKDLRSTLSPAFTGSKMKLLFGLMEECIQQFVEYLNNQPEDVIEAEVKDIFSRFSNDVIATTAFGIKVNSLKDKQNKFYLMGKEINNFAAPMRLLKIFIYLASPSFAKLLNFGIFPSSIRHYFTNIIVDTMRTRKEQNIIRPDMIHLMMEAQIERTITGDQEPQSSHKLEISTDHIVANAFLFFVAGFEPTSTFLTFNFYELAINPDVQSKVRTEINTVWKTSSGTVTYEAVVGMKYLDMVVSEALRKWPPVFFTDRIATKSYTIQPERPGEKPLVLEKGTVVWFPTFGIHRDPKLYPEPEKFDPERFSEERKHEMNPFTYLPFGLGPRNCIGSRFALLEGKLLIFHILKSFEVVPIKKTNIPMVLDKRELNLKSEGGMWLGFKKIGSSQ